MKPGKSAARIRQTLQNIHEGYQVGFAGQPRLSRAAGQLDAWVAKIKELAPRIKSLPQPTRQELTELSQSRVNLYRREAQEVRDAQAMNAPSRAAYRQIEWANLHADRYQRHFAGRARNTRDGSLLTSLSVEAQVWLEQARECLESSRDELSAEALNDFEQRIQRLQESEKMYQSELKAITEAQKSGSAQERADLYAYLANQCFALYRAHFAGHPRHSRSMTLLEQLNTQLEMVCTLMEELLSDEREQLEDPHRADRNLEIMKQNLETYLAEERAVEDAQTRLNYEGWVQGLVEAGQRVYDDYNEHFANQPRANCDPDLLCQLCDRLYDVATQLHPFVEHASDPQERAQLLMMLDQLRLYHREFGLVTEARAQETQTVH